MQALDEARRRDQYDRLVIMALPAFLGLLHEEMFPAVHTLLRAEIGKELVHEPPEAQGTYLPPGTFTRHPICRG